MTAHSASGRPPRGPSATADVSSHPKLTLEEASEAFARVLNTLDAGPIEALLAPDCRFRSQLVLEGVERVMAHLRMKCRVIRSSGYPTFAELATCPSFGGQPCVVVAQGTRTGLQAVALFKTGPRGITAIDLCVVPAPESCVRSGESPGLPADGLQ